MKYKQIPSALHNFAHSFVSLMNYVDDEYVIDVILELLPKLPSAELRFQLPFGGLEPAREYPQVLLRSARHYTEWFPVHLENHGLSSSAVPEASVVMRLTRTGFHCHVEAKDDRGKIYHQVIQ